MRWIKFCECCARRHEHRQTWLTPGSVTSEEVAVPRVVAVRRRPRSQPAVNRNRPTLLSDGSHVSTTMLGHQAASCDSCCHNGGCCPTNGGCAWLYSPRCLCSCLRCWGWLRLLDAHSRRHVHRSMHPTCAPACAAPAARMCSCCAPACAAPLPLNSCVHQPVQLLLPPVLLLALLAAPAAVLCLCSCVFSSRCRLCTSLLLMWSPATSCCQPQAAHLRAAARGCAVVDS